MSIHDLATAQYAPTPTDRGFLSVVDLSLEDEAALPHVTSTRRAEIDARQQRVSDWLRERSLDALVLFHPSTLSWFTVGGRFPRFSVTPSAALFLTPSSRCLVVSSDHTAFLLEKQLDEFGLHVKEVPWWRSVPELMAELTRGKKVAVDVSGLGMGNGRADLRPLMRPLTDEDKRRLRRLADRLVHALEATGRHATPGLADWELSAQMAHRLLHHHVEPVAVHVYPDNRADRFPWPQPTGHEVTSHACVLATGEAAGMRVTASRAFCFGTPPEQWSQSYRISLLASSAGLLQPRPGWSVAAACQRIEKVLKSGGHEFANRLAPPGTMVGSCWPPEFLHRRQATPLAEGHVFAWHVSVGGAVAADTVLMTDAGPELIGHSEHWPKVRVSIDGVVHPRADILVH